MAWKLLEGGAIAPLAPMVPTPMMCTYYALYISPVLCTIYASGFCAWYTLTYCRQNPYYTIHIETWLPWVPVTEQTHVTIQIGHVDTRGNTPKTGNLFSKHNWQTMKVHRTITLPFMSTLKGTTTSRRDFICSSQCLNVLCCELTVSRPQHIPYRKSIHIHF